jgi:hypothetical protein
MGFQRLDPQDIIVSIESATAAAWSNSLPTLTTFFTSSAQEGNTTGNYYLDVYQTSSSDTSAAIQFSIAYADLDGSGSTLYNALITGSSPTRTLYGQYRNLILGSEYSSFVFGNVTSSYFHAISIERARYKEHLLPGTMTLLISGSLGTISLTDDSYLGVTNYVDAGRVYNLISGSAGVKTSSTTPSPLGWTAASGSYGWFLPDVGLILLNGLAMSGSTFAANGSPSVPIDRSFNSNGLNNRKMFQALSGSTSKSWLLNSQETLSSDYAFIRARSGEFNYTENPSYISSSTGEIVYSSFINNPVTYVTTVGLYNDNNDLLAVAKLSRPLQKDFTKELLVRVRLDF